MREKEEEDLSELCAEILENWNSPIYPYSAQTSLHQNPFSLHHHHAQTVKEHMDTTYSIVSDVPQSSVHATQPSQQASKLKYENRKHDFESEHKDDRIMKALKPTNGKASKHEGADKSNSNTSMDRPIIPVLVVDTFFDKLLGHGADGIDVAALNKVKEAKPCKNDAEASTVAENKGKGKEKLNSGQNSSMFKCNFPTANRMPKRSPIFGEYRRMPATSAAAPVLTRSSFERGFVAKIRYVLPSNKTIFDINIDDFGEKMWRNSGTDMSDFFNYGLDEKQWKDYSKLMQAKILVRRFGQSEITADERRWPLKDLTTGEVVFNRRNDEYLPSIDSMDPSLSNSDVIVEIAMRDSSYEKEIKRQHIREKLVSTDDEGANLLSNHGNTAYINYKMIKGDKILPFPMDSYPAEVREWKEQQRQKYYDAYSANSSSERKTELLVTYSEVELSGSKQMGKQRSCRKQREHSQTHVSQRNQKGIRFYPGNWTSHNKVDSNLAESLCSSRVESVRKKMKNYVSDGVYQDSAGRTFPTNSHNSEIRMEVEDLMDINYKEDPEMLKKRRERFKQYLANS